MRLLVEFRAAVTPPDARTLAGARADVLSGGARDTVSRPRQFRRRMTGWMAGGLSLTAAAAAAVAVVMATGSTDTSVAQGGSHQHGAAISQLSGRQVLLAAATTAGAAPARAGAYWYLKTTIRAGAINATLSSWFTHDGTEYNLMPNGNAVWESVKRGGFEVDGSMLTYSGIQGLPTNPGALRARIIRLFTNPVNETGEPAPQPAASVPLSPTPDDVAASLISLLYQVPAPNAVRAAAFRALASMPGVTNLGEADGGVVLRIFFPAAGAGADMRLVIDSSTLTLRSWSNDQGTTTILAAGWTNSLPKILPNPPHHD